MTDAVFGKFYFMSVLSCKFGTIANLEWKGYDLYCHQPPGGNPGFTLTTLMQGIFIVQTLVYRPSKTCFALLFASLQFTLATSSGY